MRSVLRTTLASLALTMLVTTAALIIGSAGMFNTRLIPVNGNTLAPTLRSGDAVIASRASTNALGQGDIISYLPNPQQAQTAIARVVYATPGQQSTVITSRTGSIAKINNAEIIGRVDVRLLGAGHAIHFVQTVPGLIAGLYAPAFVIIAVELRRLSVHYDQRVYRMPGYAGR